MIKLDFPSAILAIKNFVHLHEPELIKECPCEKK
jgi:hypothetical protein